ncbi:hypothetical protein PIB30_069116 [Stylosanthes scabra]|uniref:Uncharacterized protein n=1 Tax=Stylosanthes scabra TaxID=79078 RepID=A0ABU6YPY7_9FABA|nr:hypothetical protein [Stylosanthes scabra]
MGKKRSCQDVREPRPLNEVEAQLYVWVDEEECCSRLLRSSRGASFRLVSLLSRRPFGEAFQEWGILSEAFNQHHLGCLTLQSFNLGAFSVEVVVKFFRKLSDSSEKLLMLPSDKELNHVSASFFRVTVKALHFTMSEAFRSTILLSKTSRWVADHNGWLPCTGANACCLAAMASERSLLSESVSQGALSGQPPSAGCSGSEDSSPSVGYPRVLSRFHQRARCRVECPPSSARRFNFRLPTQF